jgi:hypothetical protein
MNGSWQFVSTIMISHVFQRHFNPIPDLRNAMLSPEEIAAQLNSDAELLNESDDGPHIQTVPAPTNIPFNIEDFVDLDEWPDEEIGASRGNSITELTMEECPVRAMKQCEIIEQDLITRMGLFDAHSDEHDTRADSLLDIVLDDEEDQNPERYVDLLLSDPNQLS